MAKASVRPIALWGKTTERQENAADTLSDSTLSPDVDAVATMAPSFTTARSPSDASR